ncbi:glutathione S-transferase N-terminal domain-containing protein [Spiribacter salilacus]|nr:glutathione S-transferase N-terminal domain-containing protein [Spiribacter salilacus]
MEKPTHLALYEHELCPFCMMVRQATESLPLNIESRNILREPARQQELVKGGGRGMVPCLYIEFSDGRSEWLYESADIIDYLRRLAAA